MAFRYPALVFFAPLFGVFVLGVACEDQFVPFGDRDAGSPPSSSGGGNAAGGNTPSPPMVGGGMTVSPTGGVAGGMSTSGFGGAGGGAACAAGGDIFTMEIDRYDGEKYGCAVDLVNVANKIYGAVQTSSATSITVDECPPPQTCSPSLSTTVTWSATDLVAPMVPIGNYVTIEFDTAVTSGGCVQRLQISDLPMWMGFSSPGGADDTLWIAAADGTTDTFTDSPFFITPVAIGDCGPAGIDAFSLDFALTSDPGKMIQVFQSHLATWQVDLPPSDTAWEIRNLRSYETGNPNATTNFAYWLTPAVIQN